MKKSLFVACFLFPLALNLFSQETEKRPMTVDDALDMVRVGDALISPDGEWVFFSKSELDWKKNKRKKTYYKIPAAGGEAYQFLSEAGGSRFPVLSPTGLISLFSREHEAEGESKSEEKDRTDLSHANQRRRSRGAYQAQKRYPLLQVVSG